MKKIISIALLLLISQAYALDFSVNYRKKGRFTAVASGKSSMRKEQILEIITDLENQCMKGCPYFLPSIRESVIINTVSENEFYVWTYVSDLIDSQFFTKITIKGDVITYTNPSKGMIQSLQASQYKHKPVFQKRLGQWTLKEVLESDGKFSYTQVDFKLDVITKNRLAKTFSGQVKKKISNGIRDNYKLFK